MSAICAIWGEDASGALQRVMGAQAYRGPDGSAQWSDGQVALGHSLLATTPEALVEKLPLADESRCVITADARLDNRDALIRNLGLTGVQRVIGDGELILHAYRRWGQDCPNSLLGDFVFAIWNPDDQTLFCARDQVGMRPAHYSIIENGSFAFATDCEALLSHPLIDPVLFEPRIDDFIEDREGTDLQSTFFAQIKRLPPAHTLTLLRGKVTLRQYWKPQPVPVLNLDRDEDYEKAFQSIFTTAVQCRLRAVGPVGAMLSGGADSNAVAAIAAQLLALENKRLATFSGIRTTDPSCIESNRIRAALRTGDYDATLIPVETLGGLPSELKAAFESLRDPFDWAFSLIRAIYLKAQTQSVRIVLDGAGGDLVFNPGNRHAQLIRHGHFLDSWREARGRGHYEMSGRSLSAFLGAFWTAFVPIRLKKLFRKVRRRLKPIPTSPPGLWTFSSDRMVRLWMRRDANDSYLDDVRPFGQEYRTRTIFSPFMVAARERYERAAAIAQIEPRDPFLDLRVIDFCRSLPPSQLQRAGWPKDLLRRSLSSLIPSEVIWAAGKPHVGHRFSEQMADGWLSGDANNLRWNAYLFWVKRVTGGESSHGT